MAPIDVDPQGFTKAAGVYEAAYWMLANGIDHLSNQLRLRAGCAGDDSAGRSWANDYDPAAYDGMDRLGDLTFACGQMHDLLHFTGANHSNANSQSGPTPNPSDLVFPPGSLPIYQPPEPPKAFGGSEAPPWGWDWVREHVEGEVWPNGDPLKVKNLGWLWRGMGTNLDGIARKLDEARPLIEAQQSPETPQALEQHDIVKAQTLKLKEFCEKLAPGCVAFGEALDTAQKAIKRALLEMAALVALDQAAGWGFAWLTGGTSAAAAQGGMALIISIWAPRILATIRVLGLASQTTKVGIAASQIISRTAELLGPLLRARPALAGATEAGAAGAPRFEAFMALRRPKLTESTQKKITDRAPEWGPKGSTKKDFYEDEHRDQIKIPKSKNYDDYPEIPKLNKTDDGRYYKDPANDALYPVNPNWEFGHVSGYEHRKLVAEAEGRQPPMTQKEFDAYVNENDEYFYVQDWYHNRSHKSEAK